VRVYAINRNRGSDLSCTIIEARRSPSCRWPFASAKSCSISAPAAALAPLALPWLPPAKYQQLTRAIGITPPAEEHGHVGAPLPQHLTDRFGWSEMVDVVAQAYNALDPVDQDRCAIFCGNYGEAGAINFFGSAHGLPRAISGHNNHFLWGPQGATGEVMLVYWHDSGRAQLEALFESVTDVARFEHPYVLPGQNHRTLLLCRGLKIPMEEFWRLIKFFM
jgi:hypothetical protein